MEGHNAATLGRNLIAKGDGSFAQGTERPMSGGDDNDPNDWRYTAAIGEGSMAAGMGAAAFAKASKSLGYRTQTGYPSRADENEYPTRKGYVHAPKNIDDPSSVG